MKIKGKTLINITLIILVVYLLVDRFIVEIPNILAIPILIFGVVLLFLGWYKQKSNNH